MLKGLREMREKTIVADLEEEIGRQMNMICVDSEFVYGDLGPECCKSEVMLGRVENNFVGEKYGFHVRDIWYQTHAVDGKQSWGEWESLRESPIDIS